MGLEDLVTEREPDGRTLVLCRDTTPTTRRLTLMRILGVLNLDFFLLFLLFSIFFGIFLSIAAVLLEEISFRRYPGWQHLGVLVLAGVLENFGFRQVLSLFKVKAFWDFVRRKRHWGRMDRAGFKKHDPPATAHPAP